MFNVVDEIIDNLSGSVDQGSALPTLVCGLGEAGSMTVECLRRRLADIGLPESRLSFLELDRARSGNTPPAVKKWLINARSRTTLQWSRLIRRHEVEIEALLGMKVGQLLGAGEFVEAQARELKIAIVAEARDSFSSAAALEIARVTRKVLAQKAAGMRMSVIGMFVLPDGQVDEGEHVFAFLDDLTNGSLAGQFANPGFPAPAFSRDHKLFDLICLTGSSNPWVTLERGETAEMFAELIVMLGHPSSSATVEEAMDRCRRDTFFTLGFSAISYPARRLVEVNARRFTAAMIRSSVVNMPGEFFDTDVREFSARHGIDPEDLYKQVLSARGGLALLGESAASPIYFKDVERRYWPDRIASYDAYLQSQRTGKELVKGEDNLVALEGRLIAHIRAAVEEMILGGMSLERVRMFLGLLREHIDDVYLEAVRRKEETLKSIPSLAEKHHELAGRIQNLPRRTALATRFIALGPLLYFVGLTGRDVLGVLPARLLNQALVPSAFWTRIFLLLVVPAAFWLSYLRSESRVLAARQSYLESVERRGRYVVEYWARRAVVWLTEKGESEQLASRGLRGLQKIVDGELAGVEALRKAYHKLLAELEGDMEAPAAENGQLRASALDVLGLEPELAYKRGNYSAADELELFLREGGHRGWRRLTPEALEKRWLTFAAAGYSYALRASLGQEASSLVPVKRLHEVAGLLRQRSHPFLFVDPELPAPEELACLPANPPGLVMSLPVKAAILAAYDPHQVCYAQLSGGFELTNIRSLGAWKAAYERSVNKDELHWAGWEVIDWPAAGEA